MPLRCRRLWGGFKKKMVSHIGLTIFRCKLYLWAHAVGAALLLVLFKETGIQAQDRGGAQCVYQSRS